MTQSRICAYLTHDLTPTGRVGGRFGLEQEMADFILFLAAIDTEFFVEHIKGVFAILWRILRNFCQLAAEKML